MPSRDFEELTPHGKLRRLRAVAREALPRYGIEGARLTLLKYSWNTIFRVDAADGWRYVLRISRPGVRDLLTIHSELVWIEALSQETDVPVPRPVHARDGSLVSEIALPSVPGSRCVSAFHWIGGRHTIHSASPRVIALLGETMARLHDHADTFFPPEPFTRQRLDHIGSFTGTSFLEGTEPHPLLPPPRLALFREAAARVQAELDRLYGGTSSLRFLHLDMHLGNVKLLGNRLAVLDFDDSAWAFPVQDVGISLFYLQHLRGFSEELRDALKEGYCRRRAWPEEWDGQIDLMITARALDLVGVLLGLDHPGLQRRLPTMLQEIEDRVRQSLVPSL